MSAIDNWLFKNEDIRPYVFVRPENRPTGLGKTKHIHDFRFPDNIEVIDPLKIESADFATSILALENTAFKTMGLTMPRWALYDCSIMPGMVVGFAHRTSRLPEAIRKVLPVIDRLEWTPLSLFICIPAVEPNHWVAHNLCSVNSLLPKEENFSCMGFLSKAFGLWYFNVQHLYGVTQWKSAALTVHTSFGMFQLCTAYTPIHNIPATLTYKVDVDSQLWHRFLERPNTWKNTLKPAGFEVDPKQDSDLIALHRRIEKREGPFYLSPDESYSMSQHIPIFLA